MSESRFSDFQLPELCDQVLRLADTYRREAEKCRDSKAFLAGYIMIGAAFEALLLSFVNCYPHEASASVAAPRKGRGKGEGVKPLLEWSLAELLAVAKERNWLPSGLSPDDEWDEARAQIGDYGEVLRQIRNLVHPARYAVELPRTRITQRYLKLAFEILEVATHYLRNKVEDSLGEAFRRDPEAGG